MTTDFLQPAETIPLAYDHRHLFPHEQDVAARYAAQTEQAAQGFVKEITANKRAHLRVISPTADLLSIQSTADYIRARFQHLVVVGTGGSSLGARCLSALAPLDSEPQLHFLENADPYAFHTLMRNIPMERTAFLFISKSGGTLETMAQALLITHEMEKKLDRADVARACLIITSPGDSPMRRLGEYYGMRILDHDPELGGRFSVLSNVGLLPVACVGLDIEALRHGAQTLINDLCDNPTVGHPAVMGALYQYHHLKNGRSIHVMMPYSDRLKLLGDWFRQLTAESLGKNSQGFTPLAALGTVDHHSMLQLFLDGPADKWFTFITLGDHHGHGTIDASLAGHVGLDMLQGKSLGHVITAAQRGTIETIAAHHLPVREIRLEHLSEHTLGALLMQFMLETSLTAGLMGVNAYDQPAVEESKQRTMRHLSHH
ncbi:MAG: hypothetical protein K2Q12_07580 [Rickettsiales bacterium]|nr:hypothetical protein [Rickettsiales bacterium]